MNVERSISQMVFKFPRHPPGLAVSATIWAKLESRVSIHTARLGSIHTDKGASLTVSKPSRIVVLSYGKAAGRQEARAMEYKSNADKRRRLLVAEQNEQRDVATAGSDAAFDRMDIHAAQHFFGKRGFSRATISALAAHSLQLPEELLLMTEEEIRQISDLGSMGFDEVQAYRARFWQSR